MRKVQHCGWFVCGVACAIAAVHATEFVDIRITEDCRPAILQNAFLMQGGIDVITTEGGEEMLVGVGAGVVSPGDQGPTARLAAERKAKAKADRAIAQFLRAEVSTSTTLELETTVETELIGDQEVARKKRIERYLKTLTMERATMGRRIRQIGSWTRADGEVAYVAVGIFPDM